MITVTYIKSEKLYMAQYQTVDRDGNETTVGPAKLGFTRENAAFELGCEFGRNPQAFALPLEQLTD